MLTNKVQSAYASYLKELEFVDTGSWFVYGEEIAAEGLPVTYFGDNSLTVDEGSYSAEYHNGVLTVKSSGGSIVFAPAKSGEVSADSVTVMYGNVPKKSDRSNASVIYLDDGNNFEIVLSGSGSCNIRRL